MRHVRVLLSLIPAPLPGDAGLGIGSDNRSIMT